VSEAVLTRPLAALGRADRPAFGGKSAILGALIAAGIPVAPGFAVSTSAFRTFVREGGLEEKLAAELSRVSPEDVDSVVSASHAIGEAMRSAPVPAAVRDELAAAYATLGEETGTAEPPVAVRERPLGVDRVDATFAGQLESYLWVRGADHVADAVRDCWVSLFGPPAIAYRLHVGQDEPAMGVAVQLMVDAEVSGVLFTCNPVSGDPSMVAVNASWGLGLAVVGGEVTPDDFLVSKVTGEVVRERVHVKEVEYLPDPGGRGAVRVEVPEERKAVACLDRPALEALLDVGRRVQSAFGAHQDVEWALARGQVLPDRLVVLQSRPVTGLPQRRPSESATAMGLVMSMFGAGESKGRRGDVWP
jgi:pyruvate,water dikinase